MIYIDASRYSPGAQRTGVENYSFHLIRTLAKIHPREITLITPKKIDLEVAQIVIPFPRLWTQVRLSWEILRNKKIDNLFVPSHVLPLIHPRRSVIMIHDVAFCRFPESYGILSRWYLKWSTRFAVKHAARLITPSQATKDDLVRFFRADPEKITVIPHGHATIQKQIKPDSIENIFKKYLLAPKQYLLYIGRIERKKNLVMLIEAFKKTMVGMRHGASLKLVLVGKDGVGYEEIHATAKGDPNIVLTGYIDEETKAALLQNALAFVYPSLYEGFGFPLLEAIEYGLPILASDIPASREVADGTATFFDPADAEDLKQKIKQIVRPRDLAAEKEKQKKILSAHTWQRCAEKTWKVLIDVR